MPADPATRKKLAEAHLKRAHDLLGKTLARATSYTASELESRSPDLDRDFKRVIADSSEAIRLNPEMAEAYYLRGGLFLQGRLADFETGRRRPVATRPTPPGLGCGT